MKNETDWVSALELCIFSARSFTKGRAALEQMQQAGVTANEAYEYLMQAYKLREDPTEEEYDVMADLGDIIVGHCAPQVRIWT